MNLIGQKFNRLAVIEMAESHISPKGAKERQWLCKCDCGNFVVVKTAHLRSGHTKSCGCLANETRIKNGMKEKHGLTFGEDGKPIRLYRIWTCIKTRCFNRKDKHFPDYGGRGISVCEEWKNNFKAFYKWAITNGYSDNLTIDRIDVNGNYEPTNCRWATPKEQTDNRRNAIFLTFKGETKSLLEWSKITGIKYQTLYWRYKTGKKPEEIFEKI